MTNHTCANLRLVDRHFEGRIAPDDERTMREHLPSCSTCRARYARRLFVAGLDPRAEPARDRIGRALGIAAPSRPRLLSPRSLALVAAAAAAVVIAVLLLGWPRLVAPPQHGGFTARGSAAGRCELLVYRIDAKQRRSSRAESIIDADDELAMAYRNGCGKRRLLVFAVDERRRVYWYHPAWTDGSARPRAINISAQPGLHELPEAVAHRFAGRRITVYGVFTDEPLAVTRVEQLVGALGAPGDKLPLAHAVQRMIVLRLRPRSVRP